MPRLSTLAIFAAAVALLVFSGGCRSTVKGGTASHGTGAFVLDAPTPSGVVHIRDDRENVSTTQPSAETNTGQLPRIDGAKEGELGGVSLTALPPVNRNGLIIGGGMMAVGLAFLLIPLIRQTGTGIILMAGGAIVAFAPGLAVFIAVIALGWFVVSKTGFGQRLVRGVDHAMETVLTPAQREEFKAAMEQKQAPKDKPAIASLKAKGA